MKNLSLLLLVFSLFFHFGCSSHSGVDANRMQSGNRIMGISIKSLTGGPPEAKAFFETTLEKSIADAYSTKVVVTPFHDGLLQSPENYYFIGKNKIDDLIVVDIVLPESVDLSGMSPEIDAMSEEEKDIIPSKKINVNGTIYNADALNVVNVFSATIEGKIPSQLVDNFRQNLKVSLEEAFPNPNIYPRGNPLHFANLLLMYSRAQQENDKSQVTCQNAYARYQYYVKAQALFQQAQERGLDKIVGTQEEQQELASRMEETEAKAQQIRLCEEDRTKVFEIQYDFGSIDPTNQAFIKKAIEQAQLAELLKKYTDKPVRFLFSLDSEGAPNLVVELRFDQRRYEAWTKDRVPAEWKDLKVLSLDPYQALMQKLVFFRYLIPADAPASLRKSFQELPTNLSLTTLFNGSISFGVSGRYNFDSKRILMGYPNSLSLNIPGFDPRQVKTKSDQLFQEKGWLAFGSCKTLDGTITEDRAHLPVLWHTL